MKPFTEYKESNNAILYTGKDTFVFIVPELYFEGTGAIMMGERISVQGTIDYFTQDKNGKKSQLRSIFFPSVFITRPRRIEKQKDVKLLSTSRKQDYRFLYYEENDEIVCNMNTPEMIENTEMFFKMFAINGKVPSTIACDNLYDYFVENIHINGNDYGVDPHLLGILCAELTRDSHNLSQPYRLSKEFKSGDKHSYTVLSMIELPSYVSPAVNIASRYWDDSVIQSIQMKDEDIKDSPLEHIFYQR